jgi:hypothetical protein
MRYSSPVIILSSSKTAIHSLPSAKQIGSHQNQFGETSTLPN